jgi:hypothetical protein
MDPKGGIVLSLVTGPAVEAAVDVLAFTVFGDPTKDSIFKSVDATVGGALADVARSESFDRKVGQTISLYTNGNGTLAAKRLLVVGAGPRNDFSNPHIRDIAARRTGRHQGRRKRRLLFPAFRANRRCCSSPPPRRPAWTHKFGGTHGRGSQAAHVARLRSLHR